MSKFIIYFIYSCLQFIIVTKVDGQEYKNYDSTSFINLWKEATIKNINFQLSLKEKTQSDKFLKKILTNAQDFITVQSQIEGLRGSFYNDILIKFNDCTPLKNAYIVEHYRSAEGFSATICLYYAHLTNKKNIYQLDAGKWVLKESREVVGNKIDSVYTSIKKYLCSEYYKEESVIITYFNNNIVRTKGLYFPCGLEFNKIKKFVF